MDPKKSSLFVIDGSSFLYRAYFGTRRLTTSKGIPVNAVYSFCRMIKKLINKFSPDAMVVAWDSKKETLRHELYPDYKKTRQAIPNELITQKELIEAFLDSIGITQITVPGIEADDVMHSVAKKHAARSPENMVYLVTSDKDLWQCIDRQVAVYDYFKDILIDGKFAEEKLGFPIEHIQLYYTLLGDPTDNIPGVPGIGKKTATELAKSYATIEELYANLDALSGTIAAKLKAGREKALLSNKLFVLHDVDIADESYMFNKNNWNKAAAIFRELEFKSLLKDLANSGQLQLTLEENKIPEVVSLGYDFVTVDTLEKLELVKRELELNPEMAVDTETDGLNPLLNKFVGLSVCTKKGVAYYIPFGHQIGTQLSYSVVKEALAPPLENPNKRKYLHNAKFDILVMRKGGINLKGLNFDTLLAASLINREGRRAGLKAVSSHYLNERMITYTEVTEKGHYKDFSHVPPKEATPYSAADSHQVIQLKPIFKKQLEEIDASDLFNKCEMPLVEILSEMEWHGIKANANKLLRLSSEIGEEMENLRQDLIAILGSEYQNVNLNSPQQIEEILFDNLGLEPIKKSHKSGRRSTDQKVLTRLAKTHLVPSMIMRYRELAKLKGTYADSLPDFINPETGRIHTTYSQTSTATGRLASNSPNLQNVPSPLTRYGYAIRNAFEAEADQIFLSADYSQIELRVLASLSGVPALVNAFKENKDIHTETAAKIFCVDYEAVTKPQRNVGKRINFSIVYGLTPYGLSQELEIPLSEAKTYIEAYFAEFEGLTSWIEQIISEAKAKGYVTTKLGRRRYVPELQERHHTIFEAGRRIAINTVVQGSAAEIVKLGMIELSGRLKNKKLKAKLLLQVHDEIILELPEHELEEIKSTVKTALETMLEFGVPLVVKFKTGKTWAEASL